MARKAKEAQARALTGLGRTLGEAFGTGLGEGMESVLARLPEELRPLADEVVALLVREAKARAAEPVVVAPMLRGCAQPGCAERPVARGLCRRHYARQVYQERKERLGLPAPVPRRAARPSVAGGRVAEEKKQVSAVAPIVRRKRVEPAVEAREAEVTPAAPKAEPVVTVESVARFFGIAKLAK